MAVRLTYTGTPFVNQIRQQGFTAGTPTGGFSNRLADFFQKGPKTFTSPSLDVAKTYAIGKGGGTIPVVSSTSNLRLPSGGIPETTIGRGYRVPSGLPKFGTEVVMSPKQATAGMKSFDKMKERYSKSPRFNRLMRGEVVSGLGGKNFSAAELAKSFGKGALTFLSKAASKASLPLSILTPTEMGAAEITPEMRASIDPTGINSLRGDPAQFFGEDPFLSETRDYTDGELYDIDDTGRIPGFTDKIKGGIETMTDKLGPIGDFFSKGGIMGNVISALGKRGDESTRGIAGLNVNDVFNIDSFGSDEDPTKDPYGINIVSGMGNYNQYVKDKAKQLSLMKFKTDSGKRRQDFYNQAAAQIKAQEEKALADALARAQEEINRMGYQDYGSGGVQDGNYDTSNIDDAGNYQDDSDPGQTE